MNASVYKVKENRAIIMQNMTAYQRNVQKNRTFYKIIHDAKSEILC